MTQRDVPRGKNKFWVPEYSISESSVGSGPWPFGQLGITLLLVVDRSRFDRRRFNETNAGSASIPMGWKRWRRNTKRPLGESGRRWSSLIGTARGASSGYAIGKSANVLTHIIPRRTRKVNSQQNREEGCCKVWLPTSPPAPLLKARGAKPPSASGRRSRSETEGEGGWGLGWSNYQATMQQP